MILTTFAAIAVTFAQAPAMADAHRLDLQGAYNFRDIGGYKTADGRTMKRGLLYRSEALARLTDRDYEQLAHLKIKVLCDFRGADEKLRAPTQWRGSEIEQFPQPIEAQGSSPLMAKIAQGAPPEELKATMAALYGQFAMTNATQYKNLFRRMVDGGIPVLYHCSAGKDRTGVFTALLMTALGVPREQVIEEYLLTNKYVLTPEAMKLMAANMKSFGMTTTPDPERLKPVIGVEREYLESVFAEIDKQFGKFDNYRQKALGLNNQDVAKLKALLLE